MYLLAEPNTVLIRVASDTTHISARHVVYMTDNVYNAGKQMQTDFRTTLRAHGQHVSWVRELGAGRRKTGVQSV